MPRGDYALTERLIEFDDRGDAVVSAIQVGDPIELALWYVMSARPLLNLYLH